MFLLLYFVLRGYFSTRRILEILKETDPLKWEYLTSSSFFVINWMLRKKILWINSIRFRDYVNSEDIKDKRILLHIKIYKRAKMMYNLIIIISLFLFLLYEIVFF